MDQGAGEHEGCAGRGEVFGYAGDVLGSALFGKWASGMLGRWEGLC